MKTEKIVWQVLFRTMGPLGCICRLFGQFPFTAQQTETFQLTFHPFSLASLYTILSNVGFSLIYNYFHYISMRAVGYTHMRVIFRSWQGLFVYLICLDGFNVLGLLGELDTFDREVRKLPVVSKSKQSNSKSFFYALPPILLIIWPTLVHLKYNSALGVMFILKAVSFNIMAVSSVLFLWFSGEIIRRTHKLQTSWLKYLQLAAKHNYTQQTEQLDPYSRLGMKLHDCVTLLNNKFAFKVAVICADFFFNCLTDGYYSSVPSSNYSRLSNKVWYFIFVVLIGTTTLKLESANHIVLDSFFDIPVSELNAHLRSQLMLLMMRLERSKMELQCPGLIRYSKQFVASFALTIVTYYILVTQLNAAG